MSKLDKRAISILVIAILALSFVLPLVTVSALTISVSGAEDTTPYTFQTGPTGGKASFSIDKFYTESWSVKLYDGDVVYTDNDDYGAARVVLDIPDIPITASPTFSYWFNYDDPNDNYAFPYLILEIDTAGGSTADCWIVLDSPSVTPAENTWLEWDGTWGDAFKVHGSNANGFEGTLQGCINAVEAVHGSAEIIRAKLAVGENWAVDVTAYVDEFDCDGTVYDFDPMGVDKGDTLTVSGGAVTSGAVVNVYWDYVTSAGLKNNTEAKADGTYSVEVDVPSDVVGKHYIWAKDVATGDTKMFSTPVFVIPKLSVSPSSGLVGDEITLKGYGFSGESDIEVAWEGAVKTTTVETDELGYFTYQFDVPTGSNYGDYNITATDGTGWADYYEFTVGASLTLDVEEGPEGTVVEVSGVGFDDGIVIDDAAVHWAGTHLPLVGDAVTVPSSGEFTIEIVVPSTGEGKRIIMIQDTTLGTVDVEATFTVDGVATIEVSPTYGSPGATITLNGYNFTQIAGTEITLGLNDAEETSVGTVDTEADGSFETTFISPAITFGTYKVWANDTAYGVNASDVFKVGIIAFIINPTSGESGTNVGITGIGFSEGPYNLTFGTKLYEDHGTVSEGEAISDPFFVPNVEPGTYDLTVIDIDENELTVQFMVTESTSVSMDPAMAPNLYNVTIKGYNFGDAIGLVDFVLFNSTDDYWDMTVVYEGSPVQTGIDGNFTGYWKVDDAETLSIGDYTVNVTGIKGLLVQVPFSIVAARVSVEPRKAQFDRGDMIQFDIKNDFKLRTSFIEIYSPDDILYWSTDTFGDLYWMQVEGLYTVPYYRQTDDIGNPMELQSDAPMGPWLYRFFEDADTELMNGTFTVGPSTAAQVDERLQAVEGSLASLADDIAGVTTELSDDLGDLASDLADIASEVDDLRDDIVSDLADDIAAAADAADAAADAVSDLAAVVGDIADIATDAKSASDDAASAADDAKTAAESSQSTAQGLTTLVYGAIAASLVAALAAVVSLMQISKKIA